MKSEAEIRDELAAIISPDPATNRDDHWYNAGFRAGLEWALGEREWEKE